MEPFELNLETYCENCPDFDVVVYEEKFYYDDESPYIKRIIKCKHSKRCNNMIKYLEKKGAAHNGNK